jgi:hypothetical protein
MIETPMTVTHTPATRLGTAFRRVWLTAGLTTVGDAATAVVVPLLAITAFHASPVRVAVLVAADQFAWLLLGLPAGVLLETSPLRGLLQVAYAARAAVLATVPVAYLLGALTFWHLFTAVVFSGAAGVVISTGSLALVPKIVPSADLLAANSALSATNTAASVGGHSAGGLLVSLLGAPVAMVVEAATSALSVVALARVPEPPAVAVHRATGFGRMLREGVTYTLAHPLFRVITFCGMAVNLLSAAQYTLTFVFLTGTLGVAPVGVGLLIATSGIGALAGAAASGRLAARHGTGPTWRLALLTLPLFALLLAAARPGPGVLLFAAGNLCCAAAIAVVGILGGSARQQTCPPELIARMSATSRTITWGVIPLGALAGGALGSLIGVRPALVAVAALFVLPFTIATTSPLRKVTDLAAARH